MTRQLLEALGNTNKIFHEFSIKQYLGGSKKDTTWGIPREVDR